MKEMDGSIFITTETRLFMYLLGIIDGFAADTPASSDQYKALENTSQARILEMTNTAYREKLLDFQRSEITTLLLSHLVFLLHIDKEPIFLDQKDPTFPEISNGLVHIKSSPEEIFARRIADNDSGARFRVFSIELIIKHQSLCDKKWEKVIYSRNPRSYTTIINSNGYLDNSVKDAQHFIRNL